MRHQYEADGLTLERRVPARLVVPLDAVHAVAEPRRRRAAVDLERPEPQPAAAQGGLGEVPVEAVARGIEGARRVAPPRPVQFDELRDVPVQLIGVRGEPELDLVIAPEAALAPAHLVPEVPGSRGEEGLEVAVVRKHRARLEP